MPAASIPTATVARAAQLVGFAVAAGALAVVSWHGAGLNLPDVGQFAGIIGSGFLGGIINPLMKSLTGEEVSVVLGSSTEMTRSAGTVQERTAAVLSTKSDLLWEIAVAIGTVTIVVAALALAINGQKHPNAAPALTALATAFGALFINTSKVLHAPVAGTSTSGVTTTTTIAATTATAAPEPDAAGQVG